MKQFQLACVSISFETACCFLFLGIGQTGNSPVSQKLIPILIFERLSLSLPTDGDQSKLGCLRRLLLGVTFLKNEYILFEVVEIQTPLVLQNKNNLHLQNFLKILETELRN